MTEPSVCAVMLTANRPEMARQAVDNFRRQNYSDKWLVVLDTSPSDRGNPALCDEDLDQSREAYFHQSPEWNPSAPWKIGDLRNQVASMADIFRADILIHWDDDDYSHPNRIAEQVALLQSSGADCVGYNSMLFWRCPTAREVIDVSAKFNDGFAHFEPGRDNGEAWLYSQPNPSYALGTSFCMWRRAWESRPFEATSQGEDLRWLTGVRALGVSSIGVDGIPRMVARIHAGNTSTAYRPEAMQRASEWKRVPERDEQLRRLFL